MLNAMIIRMVRRSLPTRCDAHTCVLALQFTKPRDSED